MTKPNYLLIAHELGHAIYAYLYEPEARAARMLLKPDGNTAGCVEFDEWEGLAVVDKNVAKIKGNSYLGGLFGELIWYDRTRVMGLRGDMDELLCELRYVGKEGRYRRSRSKLFAELWGWFYSDKDDWSYGGMMRRWMDDSRTGKIMHASRVEKRLPETWKLYQKMLKHIDADAFRAAVRELGQSNKKVVQGRTLVKYAKRIIPDTVMHPEDI